MSSGSLLASSALSVFSGRAQISTPRSIWGFEGLARPDPDGSKRAGTTSRIIVLRVGSTTWISPISGLLYAGEPSWRVLAWFVVP